jgi:hypothetical protein
VQQVRWITEAERNGDFSINLTPPIVNGKPVRSPGIIYDPTTGEPFRDMQGRITNIIPASLTY